MGDESRSAVRIGRREAIAAAGLVLVRSISPAMAQVPGPKDLDEDARALLQRTSDVLAAAKSLTVDVEALLADIIYDCSRIVVHAVAQPVTHHAGQR